MVPDIRYRVKHWDIIVNKMTKAGFSVGWVSAIDPEARTIWIVDAHGYGERFIVRVDEMLTAFLELQAAIHRRFEAQLESYA